MRRSNFADAPVTYAAVGGTQAADLMTYPPSGYRPFESAVRLGSGTERFATASAQVMTWGVHKASGFTVEDAKPGTGAQYTGLNYDDNGVPLEAAGESQEAQFAGDGTPFITAGASATLVTTFAGVRVSAPVRVVFVIDEPRRTGFACGTLAGHPQSGEMSFIVEHHDDDSVWFALRSFSRPGRWFFRTVSPILQLAQHRVNHRYQRALLPARGA